MTAVVWLLVVIVGVLSLLVVGLLRSHAVILRALHDAGIDLDPDAAGGHVSGHAGGLRPTVEFTSDVAPTIRTIDGVPGPADLTGMRVVDVAGRTPSGGTRTIALNGRGATLLAFLTTGCATCATFWSEFAGGVRLPADTRLVIVTKGGNDESPADVEAMAPPGVVTIMSSEAWDDYRIPVAPYFVLVDGRRGIVAGEGAAHSWALVSQLLDRALADAGYAEGDMRRRDLLMGRRRQERIDLDLREAGIEPGDPRLHHKRVDTE